MLHLFHAWMATWFNWIHDWRYPGIFLLMALESSIVPVPAEAVVPPAAFWAARGDFSMTGVLLASTLGSIFGSLVSYALALVIGRPIVYKYGRYVLIPKPKIEMAERFINTYADGGVFFARLLPVIRHLVSIPAGFARMDLKRFILATLLGAGLWNSVLAWFGNKVIGAKPDLLKDPEQLSALLKEKLHWFVIGALVLFAAYVLAKRLSRPAAAARAPADTPAP